MHHADVSKQGEHKKERNREAHVYHADVSRKGGHEKERNRETHAVWEKLPGFFYISTAHTRWYASVAEPMMWAFITTAKDFPVKPERESHRTALACGRLSVGQL